MNQAGKRENSSLGDHLCAPFGWRFVHRGFSAPLHAPHDRRGRNLPFFAGFAHGSALEAWRDEAARVRFLAENDGPHAYEAAWGLQENLPANAQLSDRVLVLNVLSRAEAYLWAYAAGAFENTKAVVYDFCVSRAGENAKTFLGTWRGSLVLTTSVVTNS